MQNITFNTYESVDYEALKSMVFSLYEMDSINLPENNIQKTIQRAASNPEQLQIKIFKHQNEVVGYAILSSFWSNEYSGLVLILDELYVTSAYRNKGITTRFIEQLAQTKAYKQINLEVFTDNTSALNLYKRLGFKVIERIFMKKLPI